MRKINPKVIGLVVMLMSILVAGSLAVREGHGDPTLDEDPTGDGGG